MKKVVIKVCMNDDTSSFCCFFLRSSRSRAMKYVGGFRGVQSVALGSEKDRIEVTGDFDTVDLATLLREKVGHAEIVTVGEDKKKEDPPPIVCPRPINEIIINPDQNPGPYFWPPYW